MGLTACQWVSPASLEGLSGLWDSWEKSLVQREGAYHPSQSQIQLLASWHSGEGGCLETLGKQLAKPQLEWRIMAGSQVGRWAGYPAGCSGLGCALGPLLSTPGVEQIVPATAADFE